MQPAIQLAKPKSRAFIGDDFKHRKIRRLRSAGKTLCEVYAVKLAKSWLDKRFIKLLSDASAKAVVVIVSAVLANKAIRRVRPVIRLTVA